MFEYAFIKGVQLAILTDGQEWNFFLPAEQGDYGERQVYKLNIVERDVATCVERLNRYLQYDAAISGKAIRLAQEDYCDIKRERDMKAMLPPALKLLVQEEDEQLLELLADRVESLCGYKPDPNTVASFLKTSITLAASPPATPPAHGPDRRTRRVDRFGAWRHPDNQPHGRKESGLARL